MTNATTQRGFKVRCIACGSDDAIIRLDLGDLDTLSCGDCEQEFSVEDVRQHIEQWQAVLDWIDAAPSGDAPTPAPAGRRHCSECGHDFTAPTETGACPVCHGFQH